MHSDEALVVAFRFTVPVSCTALATKSLHIFGVGDLMPGMSGKGKATACLSTGRRNSLCGRNTHSNCLRYPIQVGVAKEFINAAYYSLFLTTYCYNVHLLSAEFDE